MIDLHLVCLQMELEDSKILATTKPYRGHHRGHHRGHCLPFGITSISAMWQLAMLEGIPKTQCLLDEAGSSEDKNLKLSDLVPED